MARAHRFRYDTLMRVRELQEEQRAQALGLARQQRNQAESERQHIESEQLHMLRRTAVAKGEAFEAPSVVRFFHYERYLAHRAVLKDAEIAGLKDVEEQRRRDLEEATKKKRMIERLHERHIERLRSAVAYEEQKLSDEAATQRTLREESP